MLVEQRKDIKKPILKKHVNTIHCTNNLTLVQRKLFNAFLFHAYHEIPERFQYEVPVKKLCQLIGYDSRDYKKLRKSILDLLTTAIEWNVIEDEQGEEKEKWRASSIVSAAKIENGICTYEFSSIMRELLYRPEIYGKIDIQVMTQFKSSYGLALYENCVRFQSISSTPWLPINVFKRLMGVTGDQYQSFCDLKKRVVDIAVKEVNLYSPIKVIPETQRINKKVVKIKFKLYPKKETDNIIENQIADIDLDLFEHLKREFTLSEKIALEILSNYEPGFIKEKIKLIKISDSFQTGKIRDLSAYLIDSLRRDYKPSKSSKVLLDEIRRQKEVQIKEEKRKEEALQQNLKQQKLERINNYLNSLTEEEKNHLHQAFEQNLTNSKDNYSIKYYKRFGLDSKLVQSLFSNYVADLIGENQLESAI